MAVFIKKNGNLIPVGLSASNSQPSPSPSPSGGNDPVEYRRTHRNTSWPDIPLPSEMNDANDVIYLLYDASGDYCCPAFNLSFTSLSSAVRQKWTATKTLLSEDNVSITKNTTFYEQFDTTQSDYANYKYILYIIKGTAITSFGVRKFKYNNTEVKTGSNTKILEASIKCNSISSVIINSSNLCYSYDLEYFSMSGYTGTNMSSMFDSCSSLQSIPQLDTSNVSNMFQMFASCYSLQSIPQLDTSNVSNMQGMFQHCYSLQSIPLLNTSKVTTMQNMFYYCYSLQTISQLDTSKVTIMTGMFQNCYSLQTIPQLDTSSATNMNYMFSSCYSLQSIPLLNTSKVTGGMYQMFASCYSLQSIPQLDTSKVTGSSDMKFMFNNCYSLIKMNAINISTSLSNLTQSTLLSGTELVNILNNLATVTSTQTLTLGSTNLNKLTAAEKAIATNKGWTLA